MSQKWFIAFRRVMAYFNFSFSAFKSSRLSPCSPAVLSTQRFKESMAKHEDYQYLTDRQSSLDHMSDIISKAINK